MEKKHCAKCDTEKPLEEFGKDRSRFDGLRHWCKVCSRAYYVQWRGTNDGTIREKTYHLRKTHGMSVQELALRLSKQGNKCAICGGSFEGDLRACVDHDHETGVRRGILCGSCNSGIGLLGDSVERLRAAADYLARWKPAPVVKTTSI